LFLDEIGDITPHAQVALLRVLQEREVAPLGDTRLRPVRCRVVCATNKKLKEEVAKGRFREDLYYRLCGIRIAVPGLVDRPGDIPALVRALVRKAARQLGHPPPAVDESALELLRSYPFPGNIRELENLVLRLVVMASDEVITSDAIPPEYWIPTLSEAAHRRAASQGGEHRLYKLARAQFERYLVRMMVARCHGNKKEAARRLGVSYSTVKDKCRRGDEDSS
jgi:DNA-binding NtrC family response regulator